MPQPPNRKVCGAKARHGGPCQGLAVRGSDRCRMHGGNTAKARERALTQAAQREVTKLKLTPVADPLTAMSEIAAEVIAFKDILAGLRDNVLASGDIRYQSGAGEQLRAEVAVYVQALLMCEKFLSSMGKLDVDERLARVQEAQVDLLSAALTAALTDLGLQDRIPEARGAVARHLRLTA